MAVRNFYVEAHIDGRQTTLSGGPMRKDGGLHMTIKQRDKGAIIVAATVEAYADPDGQLVLRVFDSAGDVALKVETER
jgi:hypothetical protein